MVNIPYKKTDVYDALTDEHGIFDYYFDVIMFMAVLGYREGEIETEDYLGDEDERGSIGIERFHNNNHYHAIVAALAFQKTGDPSSMADPDVHRKIIPQYAAGGLKVYEREFGDVAGDPTDALANYIKSCVDDEEVTREDDELQTIIQSFDDEMFNT
jgi:dnd system-associated protein 4